ncbi:type IV pili methyl-accepting chemotaxis transducer N-terminal domain-containing protein [Tabrizicola sp.]|uniref:type IV pili methyl-accepting chemotaxis transducer N-terminal domain-containing protein n=1 Tax=Tabrizicola sp. TaxID=2005166 RepID=UPI003F38D7CC
MFTKPKRPLGKAACILALAAVVGGASPLPLTAQIVGSDGLGVLSAQPLRADMLRNDWAPLQADLVIKAELAIEDVGASARVDYSGRLRMFSQKIAGKACQFATHQDAQHKEILIDAIAQYEKFIIALRDGDESIGIFGPEPRAKTLRDIEALLVIWKPYRAAAEAVAEGQDIEKNLDYLAENNEILLKAASDLASDINAEYANPAEMTQANAMVIDIAGRQRMLTQKMGKEACGVETAHPAFGTVEDLRATAALFDVSLNALITGMPEAGVMPPPTPKIAADLQTIKEEWDGIKVDIEAFAVAGKGPDGSETDLYDRLEVLREHMKLIVEDYRDFAALKI